MAYMQGHQLDVSDIANMFTLLDSDNNGSIEVDEFVLGTLRLKGQARCLDVMRLFQCFDYLQEEIERIQDALGVQEKSGRRIIAPPVASDAMLVANRTLTGTSAKTIGEALGVRKDP